MLRLAALALVLAAVAALPAAGLAKETRHARAALPLKGVLVPGKSLAGVRLGDSPQQVLSTWGDNYRVCDGCSLPTWFFAFDHPDAAHRGVGTGVVFRGNRAVAVFTLGTPLGWKTSDGLQLGEATDRAGDVYSPLRWHTCVGYSAMSMRPRADVVTSIYSAGETIYGFALTHASQPVCQ